MNFLNTNSYIKSNVLDIISKCNIPISKWSETELVPFLIQNILKKDNLTECYYYEQMNDDRLDVINLGYIGSKKKIHSLYDVVCDPRGGINFSLLSKIYNTLTPYELNDKLLNNIHKFDSVLDIHMNLLLYSKTIIDIKVVDKYDMLPVLYKIPNMPDFLESVFDENSKGNSMAMSLNDRNELVIHLNNEHKDYLNDLIQKVLTTANELYEEYN